MNIIRTLFLSIFLFAIHSDIYACWDDEDEAYIYGDYDDDSIWLDDVYIDDEGWADDDFDSDWWRNDDGESYDDEDDDVYDDTYDDDYIGQNDGTDDNIWTKMEKFHTPGADEFCLWWDRWEKLPARLPAQNSRMSCVPFVFEYVFNYYYGTLIDGYSSVWREYVSDLYENLTGKNVSEYGVELSKLVDLMREVGFDYDFIYSYDDIRNCIYANEAVLATIINDYGYHEIFIVSFLDDGNFKGYDPGTGKIESFSRNAIKNAFVVKDLK